MTLKPKFGKTISNIFVITYLLGTLFFRFVLEGQLHGHMLASVALGLFGLLFLWALYKSEVINPTIFGLGRDLPPS